MHILDLTISGIHQALVNKEITPLELVQEAIRRIEKDDHNAFEALMIDQALALAKTLTEPEEDNLFWGVPFMIKDNFSTEGVETTASSNILKGYVPLFNATAVSRLLEKKAIPLAKTTLDELAMGGTGTTGHKGITYNPYDETRTRLIGGSSCGSAAVVAASIVPFALGSDTGDSVRKPASLAGLVGMKPTWGRISRYGLFPFAPSLDHVGYFTRSVEDSAALLEVLAGHDHHDATSSNKEAEAYTKALHQPVETMKVAVIKEVMDSVKNKTILASFNQTLNTLKSAGVKVDIVHMDVRLLNAIYPTYITISSAEATSNNANLDGIKFGARQAGETYLDVMKNTRTLGFSELIKRRFVIGSFALMRENQEVLFLRAQKARHMITDAVNHILNDYDFIYLPAAPTVAPKFADKSDKLSDEYLIADNHLAISNFAGLPSITIPIGFEHKLPFGGNFTGRAFEEGKLFAIAQVIENNTGYTNLSAKGVRL